VSDPDATFLTFMLSIISSTCRDGAVLPHHSPCITTSSPKNSVYIQSKHCLLVYIAVCVCIFMSLLLSYVLFFSWHMMTEVFVTVVISRLLWQSHAKPWAQDRQAGDVTERVWHTVHRTSHFYCQMHSSTNALQRIYSSVVEACVFHFSRSLVSWIYTSCYIEGFDQACWLIPFYMNEYDQLFPIEIICLRIWLMCWVQNRMLFPKLMPRGRYISNHTSLHYTKDIRMIFFLIVRN